MDRIPNPYIVGTPIPSPGLFYGRQSLLAFVRDTLNPPQQRVVVLYGQRRIGKTSVLYELQRRLATDYHPVYFDLMGQANRPLSDALYEIANHIADSLDQDPPPRFSEPLAFRHYLADACSQVADGKPLLLLLDEFDDLSDQETAQNAAAVTLFDYLRDLLNIDLPVAFVFIVGRRLSELPQNFKSILKQAPYRRVSYLKEEDARILIVEPVGDHLVYTPEAIAAIYALSAGHPYFTQLICFELFRLGLSRADKTMTPDDVTAVLDDAIETGKGGLAWVWDALPLAERFVMSAIAEISGPANTASTDDVRQLLARYDLRFMGLEITEAPNLLVQWEILQDTGDGYQFSVDLVRRWILQEHPLGQARREVENISPRANRYFDNAREAHQADDLGLAIADYQQALAANPNHLRAQLGLAQALSEHGEAVAAHDAYRSAYELDPANAADSYAHSFEVLAARDEQAGEPEEALLKLEQAQEVVPTAVRHQRIVALQQTVANRQDQRNARVRQLRLGAIVTVAVAVIAVLTVFFVIPALNSTDAAPAAPGETLILVANFEGDNSLVANPGETIAAAWQEAFPEVRVERVDTLGMDSQKIGALGRPLKAVAVINGTYSDRSLYSQISILDSEVEDGSTTVVYDDDGRYADLEDSLMTQADVAAFAASMIQEFKELGLDRSLDALSGHLEQAEGAEASGPALLRLGEYTLNENREPYHAGIWLTRAMAQGFFAPVVVTSGGADLVFVPEGPAPFQMGRDAGEAAALCAQYGSPCNVDFDSSQPVRDVVVADFFIDRTEVPNEQYQRCVDEGICSPPALPDFETTVADTYFDEPRFPVIYVGWEEAQRFCEWRHGRLPTEAEWEKAARWHPLQGTQIYPWGEQPPAAGLANFDLIPGSPGAVDSNLAGASPVGTLNQPGNVWEWVSDWYEPAHYKFANASDNQELNVYPVGPDEGELKVFRGGSHGNAFNSNAVSVVDPALRAGHSLDGNEVTGFRCVFDDIQALE